MLPLYCCLNLLLCLSQGSEHLLVSYLIINSLKHRRSLLWWRKSFGSAGISFRKTWATSNGPCSMGEERESGGKEQKQKDIVTEGVRKRKENMAEEGMSGSAWEFMNKRKGWEWFSFRNGGKWTYCLMQLGNKALNQSMRKRSDQRRRHD